MSADFLLLRVILASMHSRGFLHTMVQDGWDELDAGLALSEARRLGYVLHGGITPEGFAFVREILGPFQDLLDLAMAEVEVKEEEAA